MSGKVVPFNDRLRAMLARMEPAVGIAPVLNRPYVVKNWLDRGAVSVVYGPANVGKSFFALDLAHHVRRGERWGGCAIGRGQVLYVAAEGGAMFSNRVAALGGADFWVLRGAVNLGAANGDARTLADAVAHLAQLHGPFALIIIDTLARVMGAGDENNGPDMANLLRGVDLLRERTGAHVMLIHHSGKNAALGARGHSSLRAAVDTEIEITRDEYHLITAETTKQRDMPSGRTFKYRLKPVVLGTDDDGDEVTTCIVEREA